jgi:hypothetical protein
MMSESLMSNWKKTILSILASVCFVLLPATAKAESDNLILLLNLPNEGETFYAGPSSLIYNTPIEGWVNSPTHDPSNIKVLIEVIQDSKLIASQEVIPDRNGVFRLYGQVNPGAYVEFFNAELIPCGDTCHVDPDNQFSKTEWDASFAFPPGVMTLSVTATDPDGNSTSLERRIIVDRSQMVVVPIQVEFVSDGDLPIEGIPISGSAWMYMWRSRIFSGGTDSNGLVNLKVEALSEKSTDYRFEVKPTVINGVKYESVSPVDITLPPGGVHIPPVVLQVKANLASIAGKVTGDHVPSNLTIWAIPENNGEILTAQVEPDGSFLFKDIPVTRYTLGGDSDSLAKLGYSLNDQHVDLTVNSMASVELNLSSLEGMACQGVVHDKTGNILPFSWGSLEGIKDPIESSPDTGIFSLYDLPEKNATLIINAPGFYSQAKVISPGTESCAKLTFDLTMKPESHEISWGNGSIIVPEETLLSQSGNHIFIERGWLWGKNTKDESIILQIGPAEITIAKGQFALQVVPGLTPLFFLVEGKGSIQIAPSTGKIPIDSGQMILIQKESDYQIMSIEPSLTSRYLEIGNLPVTTIYEPTLEAAVLNKLALIGIDAAKLVTFVTYAFIIISIMLLPVIMIIRWRRKSKLQLE